MSPLDNDFEFDFDDDDLPEDIESIADLFSPFYGPLTADDIARIERSINVLVAQLFEDDGPEKVKEELDAPLADKIDGYIGIADSLANDPDLNIPLEFRSLFQQRLRELLQMVNEYNHKLN